MGNVSVEKVKKANPKRSGRAKGRTRLAPSGGGTGNGTRPKRTRNRVAKKQALILAALRLFASKGYEVTTTREIAASAGCAEGLIHRYFKGKAGLLMALIEHRASNEPALAPQIPPSPNLEDEFVLLVEREVERMWESRDLLRVFVPRAIVDPAVGTAMIKSLISGHAKTILARLKNQDSRVTLSQDAIEALAQSVGTLGLVFGFVRPVLLGQDRQRAKKMAATVARILVGNPTNSLVA